MLWKAKDSDFKIENHKGPSVGHYKYYHSMFESHGDYTRVELIKRSLVTI
jgi:hypothetical protein